MKISLKQLSIIFTLSVFAFILSLAIDTGKQDTSQVFSFKPFLSEKAGTASIIDGTNEVERQDIADYLPLRDWSKENIEINSLSAVCAMSETDSADYSYKILFGKNYNLQLPIASLTKLMTALVVMDNYNLEKTTVISEKAVAQEGEQGFLIKGETLSIDNLLDIMLVESSNDAAYALAEIMGVQRFIGYMNEYAEQNGMDSSNFVDPAGLGADNYSTAIDLAKLTDAILKRYPEIFSFLAMNKVKLFRPDGTFHHELSNTNELLDKIPNIIGGKTGKTAEANGCLLLAIKNGFESHMICVLLNSDNRFSEMQKMVEWVAGAYKFSL